MERNGSPSPGPPKTITSTAIVASDRAERLAKQLITHFGTKVDWVPNGDGVVAEFAPGVAGIATDGPTIVLTAEAETEADLGIVEGALASHLERFAFRHPVTVTVGSRRGGHPMSTAANTNSGRMPAY